MRHGTVVILNLAVPGTGLIALRREWLGASLALLFGMTAQLGLWGCLINASAVPSWLAACSLSAAAAIWLFGQVLVRQQLVALANPELRAELLSLREQVTAHMQTKHYDEAWSTLCVALSIDDEDLQSQVLAAELMTILGRFAEARRSWKRVAQLDREGSFRDRRIEAVANLTLG